MSLSLSPLFSRIRPPGLEPLRVQHDVLQLHPLLHHCLSATDLLQDGAELLHAALQSHTILFMLLHLHTEREIQKYTKRYNTNQYISIVFINSMHMYMNKIYKQ